MINDIHLGGLHDYDITFVFPDTHSIDTLQVNYPKITRMELGRFAKEKVSIVEANEHWLAYTARLNLLHIHRLRGRGLFYKPFYSAEIVCISILPDCRGLWLRPD